MRVVIAEDLFLLRDGLIRMLEAHGFEVAAAVDTGAGLLAAVEEHQPDAAVVDVRLPPTFTDEGLQAALEARRRVPGLPVLVLSQYVEQIYARELLADGSGGVGYLLKDRVFDSAQFAEALRRVAGGGTAMDPEVISRLLARNADDSELVANVSKHADAQQVWIDMRYDRGLLRIDVGDDGRGGADPGRGTGLRGIERRLSAFDGILALSSPPGGPTVATLELPCELSSPRTSSF